MAADSINNDNNNHKYVHFADLAPSDILLGRGSFSDRYPGNVRFRALVAERKPRHAAAMRQEEKTRLVEEVWQEVEATGGRFLRKVDAATAARLDLTTTGSNDTLWEIVDDKTAIEKIKQAFRDVPGASKRRPSTAASTSRSGAMNDTSSHRSNRPSTSLSTQPQSSTNHVQPNWNFATSNAQQQQMMHPPHGNHTSVQAIATSNMPSPQGQNQPSLLSRQGLEQLVRQYQEQVALAAVAAPGQQQTTNEASFAAGGGFSTLLHGHQSTETTVGTTVPPFANSTRHSLYSYPAGANAVLGGRQQAATTAAATTAANWNASFIGGSNSNPLQQPQGTVTTASATLPGDNGNAVPGGTNSGITTPYQNAASLQCAALLPVETPFWTATLTPPFHSLPVEPQNVQPTAESHWALGLSQPQHVATMPLGHEPTTAPARAAVPARLINSNRQNHDDNGNQINWRGLLAHYQTQLALASSSRRTGMERPFLFTSDDLRSLLQIWTKAVVEGDVGALRQLHAVALQVAQLPMTSGTIGSHMLLQLGQAGMESLRTMIQSLASFA